MNENDIQSIEKLSTEKFTTWEWNFGYSPKYSFKNVVEIEGKYLKIDMLVERGLIIEVEISGEYFTEVEALNIKHQLVGKRNNFEEISSV